MRLTLHADHRRILRRLPTNVLETIIGFGSPILSKGAVSLVLDDETIELAAEDDRRRRIELERYRGAYVIVGDHGRVITAARRTRRFRR